MIRLDPRQQYYNHAPVGFTSHRASTRRGTKHSNLTCRPFTASVAGIIQFDKDYRQDKSEKRDIRDGV